MFVPSYWPWTFCLGVLLILQRSSFIHADKSKEISVPSYSCGRSAVKVDAAHLTSASDTNRDSCTIKLKGDEDYFLINYEHMSLQCGQTIKVYYKSSTSSSPDQEFNCHNHPYVRKTTYIKAKYLTITFSKPPGIQRYNFSIVATSFEKRRTCSGSDRTSCMDGHYGLDEVCIDSDLECDGVNNCANSYEELTCLVQLSGPVQGVAVGIVITIVVISILACVGCIVAIVCCCKRKGRPGTVVRQPATQNVVVQPPVQQAPATAPYYPTGTQAPGMPPGGYQQPGVPPGGYQQPGVPPGGYQQTAGLPPGGYQQQLGPTPGGYQPVPTAPPGGDLAYPPPAPYNPGYSGAPPAYPANPDAPPAYPGTQPVQYNAQGSDVKVPL